MPINLYTSAPSYVPIVTSKFAFSFFYLRCVAVISKRFPWMKYNLNIHVNDGNVTFGKSYYLPQQFFFYSWIEVLDIKHQKLVCQLKIFITLSVFRIKLCLVFVICVCLFCRFHFLRDLVVL